MFWALSFRVSSFSWEFHESSDGPASVKGAVHTERLTVELCGVSLRSPLIPAAGTLSKEAIGEAANIYGAILPKTATPSPRSGNPPPRIAETPSGMINSIGLQNPGIEALLADLDAYDVGSPIFVSVAGETVAEFADLCERLASDERVAAVELNLSCPNVERDGEVFCSSASAVSEVVAACRTRFTGKLLFAKLASEGAVRNAVAAEQAGADALTLINTVPALAIDAYEREVIVRGGLSGPAIKPVALRAVYEVTRKVGVPVIGCGGVARGTDVAEFLLAGAAAVQVGSGSFAREAGEILREFSAYLEDMGCGVRDLVGAATGR